MTRPHITNPTVTVIMDTIGGHQDSIAAAIRSFMAQDYQFCRLLILNRHPSPLVLTGIPDAMRMRIDVVNAEDTFIRPVHQHAWNLKQIRTDCWTILDDDDWMEPGHISQLVEYWNGCTDRNEKPLHVTSLNYTVHYDDRTVPLRFRGWAVSLFETLTADEVDLCFKRFPQDVLLGSDTWIAWNSYFDNREFEGEATYHWERRGKDHVSSHETNRGETDRERFEIALNFWRIKLVARASVLRPVNLASP